MVVRSKISLVYLVLKLCVKLFDFITILHMMEASYLADLVLLGSHSIFDVKFLPRILLFQLSVIYLFLVKCAHIQTSPAHS